MTSIWTVRRSRADAKLTGLCGGLAQHWGIDPVLVRLGFTLLALSGGVGVVLYVAGWLLVPVAGTDRAPVDGVFGARGRRWPKEVWVSLVLVATVVVLALCGSMSPFGLTPAVMLAGLWYVGCYRKRAKNRRGGQTQPPEPPATPHPAAFHPSDPATPSWPTLPAPQPAGVAAYADPPAREQLERQDYFSLPDPVGLYAEPEPAPTVVIRRGDSPAARRLRLLTLVAVGLTLAGLGLADNLGLGVPLLAYLGAPLLVLGLALIVATWVGRARGLLPVALLLGVAVLASASMPAPGAAVRNWSPKTVVHTEVSQLPPGGDHLDVGHLRVDLSQLNLTAAAAYTARVDAGQLEVIVPADVNVVVHYALDAGSVRIFGQKVDSGPELRGTATGPTPPDASLPTLTLDVGLDVGTLAVHP